MPTFPTAISTLAGVLNKRQLSQVEATQIELKICTQSEAEDELRMRLPSPAEFCERLPYHGLHGEYLEFARYRINYKAGHELDKDGKPWPKYMSPKGLKRQFVYLPVVDGMDWEAIISNPAESLVITEGEYKSITACKHTIPCVGLGGVWNFNSSAKSMPPPLDQASWIGKRVYICFDADELSTPDMPLKKQVADAAYALASKLAMLSADVRLLDIARTSTFAKARERDIQAKMGLDDFLFADGDFGELLATARELIECKDMAVLFSQYAMCGGNVSVSVMDTLLGKQYRVHEFLNYERARIRKVVGPKGGVSKVYVAEEFLERRDKPLVQQIIFEPAEMPGYDRERATYNQWTGWPEFRSNGTAEFKREVDKTWRRLIEKLFEDEVDYFEKWCAHLIQRPGEKTSIGVILTSLLNGVGKSLLGEILRGLVGSVHGKAVPLERLKSNFNSILERCLFLQIDEANGLADGLETKLNDLISSDTIVIENKGFNANTVSNYMRIYMTSNSPYPIRLMRENRRWFIAAAGVKTDELAEWSLWLDNAAKLLKSQDGIGALRERLERLDIVDWNPTARVKITSAMDDMVEASQSWNSIDLDKLYGKLENDWEAGKLWFITPDLNKGGGNKLLGFLKARVRDNGGQTLKHEYQAQGTRVRGQVIDFDGSLPRKPESTGAGNGPKWALDASKMPERFDKLWASAVLRANAAFDELDRGTRSDKY